MQSYKTVFAFDAMRWGYELIKQPLKSVPDLHTNMTELNSSCLSHLPFSLLLPILNDTFPATLLIHWYTSHVYIAFVTHNSTSTLNIYTLKHGYRMWPQGFTSIRSQEHTHRHWCWLNVTILVHLKGVIPHQSQQLVALLIFLLANK